MKLDAPEPIRASLLREGLELTTGDRNAQYGEPIDNLTSNAELVSAYLLAKYRGCLVDEKHFSITPEDIAWIMVLTKIARTFHGQPKADTYTDAATYAAIAGEVAILTKLEEV